MENSLNRMLGSNERSREIHLKFLRNDAPSPGPLEENKHLLILLENFPFLF